MVIEDQDTVIVTMTTDSEESEYNMSSQEIDSSSSSSDKQNSLLLKSSSSSSKSFQLETSFSTKEQRKHMIKQKAKKAKLALQKRKTVNVSHKKLEGPILTIKDKTGKVTRVMRK